AHGRLWHLCDIARSQLLAARASSRLPLASLSRALSQARVTELIQEVSESDPGPMSASLIGRSGSSAFRLSTTTVSMSLTGSCFSSESAPGALPSWDSRTRWNNLSGGLAVRRTVGPSGHANSPHPSSREGHHSTARWSSSVLLLD